MPKGSKRSYTSKKSSRTSQVEKNGKSRSASTARAKQMAYATASKEENGGKRSSSGSGRGKRVTRSASSRSSQKTARP